MNHRTIWRVPQAALFLALLASSHAVRADDPPATAPSGRAWSYVYDGTAAASPDAAALDGSWNHDNGSDAWDGSIIGDGLPGGVMSIPFPGSADGYLRMQETGDPRDYPPNPSDPSNRKLYFGHDISAQAAPDDVLSDVELAFRLRIAIDGPLDDLHPDGGSGIVPWPAGGLGYRNHDGNKGVVGVRQAAGGLISFSVSEEQLRDPAFLILNSMEDGGAPQNLPLPNGVDPTQWMDFEVGISAGGAGTHQVDITLNGLPLGVFDVTASGASDFDTGYLAMGLGATPQAGAIDVDYVAISFSPVPEPAGSLLLLLGLAVCCRRRRRSA